MNVLPQNPSLECPIGKKHAIAFAVAMCFCVPSTHAASFTVNGASTTAQTLGSGSGQTGTVNSGSSLTVSGSNVAVTISGNNATLNNQGSIVQTGTGRVVRDNTGVSGLMITNGSVTNSAALMQAADADVIQMNKSPASVTLNNYGTMTSLNASKGGSQAVDFNAIQSGTNIINNYSTGVMQAQDADAVRPGVNGVVNNYGKIIATNTTDTGDDGIDAQTNTGVTINNNTGGSIVGARHGITGGNTTGTGAYTMAITNGSGALIQGNNGSGVNIDGINANEVVTLVNHGTITGNGVTQDGDGVDVDGVVNITNTGVIRSINAAPESTDPPGTIAQSEGVTVGGGTIVNSGTIEGDVAAGNLSAVGRGITLAGIDTSGAAQPIYANSVVTNQSGGLIKGQNDSAIVVGGGVSGFTVTINNNAGATILGGSVTYAAIRTGADNDTINNAGSINGASSGKAIDMGAGNNALYITGGAASIIGDISGGTGGTNAMHVDPGAGNSFSYASSISNFSAVQVHSGTVTLSGQSTYTGTTQVSGGTLILDGVNRLSTSSALDMDGGTLKLTDVSTPDDQTFSSFSLTDNSTIDLDASSLTFDNLGSVVDGKTLTILDYLASSSPDYALRFLGDWSNDPEFLALIGATTIDGQDVKYAFDGIYTDITEAIPEPQSIALLIEALGLLGVVSLCRKKRASAS